MEREPALQPPTLQFDEAIVLPRRMTLGERHAAGLREHLVEEDGLMDDARRVTARDLDEELVADIGPGTQEREIIVDAARHGGQSVQAAFAFSPNRP